MSKPIVHAQLRAFVQRIERVEEEIKALNDDKRDLYAEAKGNGYDLPALKAVIARRRKDPNELKEREAIIEVYLAALGTDLANNKERAPARDVAA